MMSYKVLKQNEFKTDKFSIVPLRYEDRLDIMKWRNEQIYHLRQAQPLTEELQNKYFDTVISKLFEQDYPNQILFSYLEDDICIGYGGLVHINWVDQNAEISFIMNTELENDHFDFHWEVYLDLLEQVAFKELDLHKLYIYAFDLRPHLYRAIRKKEYVQDAVLKDHCYFNGEFKNVVIHYKLNS